ncbi:ABC transporter substrate-binding protein [Serratia rubidaea]|uniref:ABC transporter substrate-binding protein n=1 Tax=Serratia rubidaea TaxID=61652 RepID=UPI0023B12F2D|nr:ABC transporter substrate-binding protein [Serratia rubidaea]MDK1705582.1 ABC transporter substrate-binding protein [Serratia rubidaea]
MKKIKRMLVSALWLLAWPSIAAEFPVTVESCGEPLTFSAPPQRAVINDLNMAEMAFALGLQPHIVGLTGISGWYQVDAEFKRQQGVIPELADKYPSLETLLAANPDFFFAGWNYGMKIGGEVTPQSLAKYGVKTLVLSESCIWAQHSRPRASMTLLYDDILKLGKIFGRETQAVRLVNRWRQQLATLRQRIGERPAPKVFVYDSGEDKPFTSGKYAMPTALIEAAGGKNVMDTLAASWATTSWEDVARQQPDVIVLLDYQQGGGAARLQQFLAAHPLMKFTPAVRHQRYLRLKYAELTPGPANIMAIEKLARVLYPEVFG